MGAIELSEELRTIAAELLPDWDAASEVQRIADDEYVLLRLQHPLSSGHEISVKTDHPHPHEWLRRVLANEPDFTVIGAAPELDHRELVLGLRTHVRSWEWPYLQVRGLARLLLDTGALTADEASWVAGYFASDAPMAPEPMP